MNSMENIGNDKNQEIPQLKKVQLDENKLRALNEIGLKNIRETCQFK
jgi:serine/threonine-protein kinase RIO1